MCFFIITYYANCGHTVRKFCQCLVQIHSITVRPCGPTKDVYLDGAPELDICPDCRTKRNNEWRAEARDPKYAEDRDRYASENNRDSRVSKVPVVKRALVPPQDAFVLQGPVQQQPPPAKKRTKTQASIAPPPPPVHKIGTGMSQPSSTWTGSGQDDSTHLAQGAANGLGEAQKLKEYTPTPIVNSRVISDSPLTGRPSFNAVEQLDSAARGRIPDYTYSAYPLTGVSELPWQTNDYGCGPNINTRQQSATEAAFNAVDVHRPWLHTASRQADNKLALGSHQQNTYHIFGPATYPAQANQDRSAENTNNYFDGQMASTIDGGDFDHMPELDVGSRQVSEPFPTEDASLDASPMDSGHTSDQAMYSRQTSDSCPDGQQSNYTKSHRGQDGGSESPPVDPELVKQIISSLRSFVGES